MDVSAIVLKKLLTEQNIELWAKLKLVFLDAAFTNLYGAISRFYDKYGNIPSFQDLELTLRDGPARITLETVRVVECDDIESDVALNALLDQFTQNEALKKLDQFLDKLPIYDSEEIKENLSSIVLHLDEKTLTTEGVFDMGNIMIFRDQSELLGDRIHLRLNNKFDAELAGVAKQELILLGGHRGSGKSVICSNVQINEYESGYVCPYFTIEMIAQETFQRNMAILANINHQHLKQGTLTDEEVLSLVKARAGMFLDSDDLVEEFKRKKDRYGFEMRLVREKVLKPDNQMIIIDDRALSLTSLDLHLGKIKSKFGDKFRLAVVDYLNQIVLDSSNLSDQFGWKEQTTVSKKLKELARKHDICIFSPYQIDRSGEARFGKGILDAADIAMTVENFREENALFFDTSKIRGGPPINFTSSIDWTTLRISPIPVEKPVKGEEPKEPKRKIKNATHKEPTGEPADELAPW